MEQLLILQDRDQHIRDLRKQLDDLPQHKLRIEARLEAHQKSMQQAETSLKEAQAAIKGVESEIEACRQKITRFREQQLQIKSNVEYKALEKEILVVQKEINGFEDKELVLMEKMDALRKDMATRQESLRKEKERVDEEVRGVAAGAGRSQEELAKLEAERAVLVAGIDPEWLSRYEKVFKKKGDMAIALVNGGVCGGCHMKLPPSVVHEARRGNALTVCNFCGRMVYSPVR